MDHEHIGYVNEYQQFDDCILCERINIVFTLYDTLIQNGIVRSDNDDDVWSGILEVLGMGDTEATLIFVRWKKEVFEPRLERERS